MSSQRMLQHYAAVATRAAVAAGTFVARYVGRPGTVKTKRSPIDLVTEIDRDAERLIHTILHRAYPGFGFLGEEHGERRHESSFRWVVDPLDGTNNFVHGLPFFGVSIGLERRGIALPPHDGRALLVGVIYDPMRRELFAATRGGGAFMNGKRIRVSPTRRLARSLLSTGFSSAFLRHDQPYLAWFQAAQRRSHGVRRMGSTVLSLAAVAAGRMEGFYERDLWPWDMAAGVVLIQEAGGRVTNFEGNPPVLTAGRLVATNGHIHRALLRLLNRVGSP